MSGISPLRSAYSALRRLQSPARWLLALTVFAAGAWFFDWKASNPDYANGAFMIVRGLFLALKWLACAGSLIAVLAMISELVFRRDRDNEGGLSR